MTCRTLGSDCPDTNYLDGRDLECAVDHMVYKGELLIEQCCSADGPEPREQFWPVPDLRLHREGIFLPQYEGKESRMVLIYLNNNLLCQLGGLNEEIKLSLVYSSLWLVNLE